MKQAIIVHHHIFKNAGTSFSYALKQFYGKNFMEYDLPGGELVTEAKLRQFIVDHSSCRAISGHHIAFPTPQGKSFKTLSAVILRRPLARIESIYEFERKQLAATEGAIMAKRLNFREFVLWRLENNPLVFCNYQTYYCSRSHSIARQININEELLALAIKNLKNSAIVGIVERFDESIQLAQSVLHRFEPNIKLRTIRLNATKERDTNNLREDLIEKLGANTVKSLESWNVYDRELYNWANSKL